MTEQKEMRPPVKAVLLAVDLGQYDAQRSLEELAALAEANGMEPVGEVLQKRDAIDVATVLGEGRVAEAKLVCQNLHAEVAIFDGELSGSQVVAYFNKPGAAPSDTRIWTYDAAVLEITGIPEDAQLELLDYPGDRVDFYEGATVGILKDAYGGIPASTLVILGTYRGDPVYNYVEIQARYSTTPEAGEVTTIERTMSGEVYLLVEIPEDGAVSDTSDGFFIFVPDLDAEADLSAKDGVTDAYPLSIRAVLYRTDKTTSADSQRVTSQTLWISFPESGENGSDFPIIELTGNTAEK